ncbi:imm11 family protein [Paenibacillus bouchesdurhonensis]|uniref:imm11 family protein n=1 Tax=Paenibacillus bouchesdurhonensis TaxID=1870990 RepID=UPI000DA5FB76
MDYFVMQQDERYTDTPVLQNIRQKIDIRHMNRLRSHQIADTTIFQVKASTETEYLDLLSDQLYLMSEKLKKLIAMYEPDCIFKHIPLMDQFNSKQSLYFLPFFEEVEALSSSSEFNADRSVIKKLVLQGEKVAKKRIFRVQESEQPLIIVRLDVAESILRRDMIGVSLKKVLVE